MRRQHDYLFDGYYFKAVTIFQYLGGHINEDLDETEGMWRRIFICLEDTIALNKIFKSRL